MEYRRGASARLSSGCYVGCSRISENIAIEIHEKVHGSLPALLKFASGSDFRVEQVGSFGTDMGPLIALLAAQLVESVRRYAGRGREFAYERILHQGSLVGGRLHVTKTAGLHSRGLRHLAAFEKNVISFDLPINRTVLMALREVERIGRIIKLPSTVVAHSRALAMVFDDCRSEEVLFGSREQAALMATRLSHEASDKDTADMLALAATVLARESFEGNGDQTLAAPRSWFLNLEMLFERAVRETIRKQIRPIGGVVARERFTKPIFPPRTDQFCANPDIVVELGDSNRTFIGDAKYKQWSSLPSASDVYQLLVHASAFSSEHAFLVFPCERFEAVDLGCSVTGIRTIAYGVNVCRLDEGVREVLEHLGLLCASSERSALLDEVA